MNKEKRDSILLVSKIILFIIIFLVLLYAYALSCGITYLLFVNVLSSYPESISEFGIYSGSAAITITLMTCVWYVEELILFKMLNNMFPNGHINEIVKSYDYNEDTKQGNIYY